MTRDTVALALLMLGLGFTALVLATLVVAVILAIVAIARSVGGETCAGVAILAVLVFVALDWTEAAR